jgi:hypothetical protein
MVEMAMVFTRGGHPLFWLGPKGCTNGSVPDSSILWDRIWRDRHVIGGVAHTHPWLGITSPSHTDITTFAAIEAGLGKRLYWPIVTMTHVEFFQYSNYEGEPGEYERVLDVNFRDAEHWHDVVRTLRQLSRTGG